METVYRSQRYKNECAHLCPKQTELFFKDKARGWGHQEVEYRAKTFSRDGETTVEVSARVCTSAFPAHSATRMRCCATFPMTVVGHLPPT